MIWSELLLLLRSLAFIPALKWRPDQLPLPNERIGVTNGGNLQHFNRLSETERNNLQPILALVVQLLACFYGTLCSYHKSVATYYFVGHVWCKFFFYLMKNLPMDMTMKKSNVIWYRYSCGGKNCLSFNGCSDSLVERVRLSFIPWIYMIRIGCLCVHFILHACKMRANNDSFVWRLSPCYFWG